MTQPVITLGMRLQIARRAAGLKGVAMAEALNVTTTTISRYENDSTPVPVAVLYAYQALCDVPLEWLRGEMELTQERMSSRCTDECPCQEPYPARAA